MPIIGSSSASDSGFSAPLDDIDSSSTSNSISSISIASNNDGYKPAYVTCDIPSSSSSSSDNLIGTTRRSSSPVPPLSDLFRGRSVSRWSCLLLTIFLLAAISILVVSWALERRGLVTLHPLVSWDTVSTHSAAFFQRNNLDIMGLIDDGNGSDNNNNDDDDASSPYFKLNPTVNCLMHPRTPRPAFDAAWENCNLTESFARNHSIGAQLIWSEWQRIDDEFAWSQRAYADADDGGNDSNLARDAVSAVYQNITRRFPRITVPPIHRMCNVSAPNVLRTRDAPAKVPDLKYTYEKWGGLDTDFLRTIVDTIRPLYISSVSMLCTDPAAVDDASTTATTTASSPPATLTTMTTSTTPTVTISTTTTTTVTTPSLYVDCQLTGPPPVIIYVGNAPTIKMMRRLSRHLEIGLHVFPPEMHFHLYLRRDAADMFTRWVLFEDDRCGTLAVRENWHRRVFLHLLPDNWHVNAYNRLLMEHAFWELFENVPYMMIYETDVYICPKAPNLWERVRHLGTAYDMVGGPWPETWCHERGDEPPPQKYMKNAMKRCVGNSGFSLWRAGPFLELTSLRVRKTWNQPPAYGVDPFLNEQMYYSRLNYNPATRKIARNLSIESWTADVQVDLKNLETLPVGGHKAWGHYWMPPLIEAGCTIGAASSSFQD